MVHFWHLPLASQLSCVLRRYPISVVRIDPASGQVGGGFTFCSFNFGDNMPRCVHRIDWDM